MFATVICAVATATVVARGAVVQGTHENCDDDEGEDRGCNPGVVEGGVAGGVRGRRRHARDASRGIGVGKVKNGGWWTGLTRWFSVVPGPTSAERDSSASPTSRIIVSCGSVAFSMITLERGECFYPYDW